MFEVKKYLEENQFPNVYYNEPLSKYTTFRVGGKASIFVIPETKKQIIDLVTFLKDQEIPFKIIGNASNLLPSDKNFQGVVIKTNKALNKINIIGEEVVVESGYSLVKLAYDMIDYELQGLEFLGGIPGTIGGAVYMNAGAYNKEMKDVIKNVILLNQEGKLVKMSNQDLQYAYRQSRLQSIKPLLILEATLKLEKGKKEDIKALLEKRKERRINTQPLNYPCGGSTFKNPTGTHAYLLIDKAGLRGYSIGGAKVSCKHCNFIINYNNATSDDIKNLIEYVIKKVYEQTGTVLVPEIEFFNW